MTAGDFPALLHDFLDRAMRNFIEAGGDPSTLETDVVWEADGMRLVLEGWSHPCVPPPCPPLEEFHMGSIGRWDDALQSYVWSADDISVEDQRQRFIDDNLPPPNPCERSHDD